MKYPNVTLGHVEAVWNKLGGEEGVEKFLRDELVIQAIVVAKPTPEPVLDFIVHVDRSVKPTYPNWVDPEWINSPEFLVLECSGPTDYDLQTQVEQWLHDDQKSGTVRGKVIYDHLQVSNELVNHLGLSDLLVIQAKGIKVFRQLFEGKAVFGWRSVVQDRDGDLLVPYLYESGGRVVLDWHWLVSHWDAYGPALRLRK